MKTIIAGSRHIDNFSILYRAIKESGFEDKITEIISGGAMGVDRLGEKFARMFDIPLKIFPADWKKYENSAGPIRNRQMAEYGKGLIAVWSNDSRGTQNMIETAKELKLKVFVYKVKEEELLREASKEALKYESNCDFCGSYSKELVLVNPVKIAGLFSCPECLK